MNRERFNSQRRKLLIGGGIMLVGGALQGRALAQPQRRVIVVGGALAEVVYALGAQAGAHETLCNRYHLHLSRRRA